MTNTPDPLHLLRVPDPVAHIRLRTLLAQQATRFGDVEVAYRTVGSPVGELLLAATARGLVRVAYAQEGHDVVLQQLADQVDVRVLWAPPRLDDTARQLEEYFAGRRTGFDLPLDLRLLTDFRRDVLNRLQQVPYGLTTSYAGLAVASGRPAAVRAVGTACARNPVPVVVPCHRVVRSDGHLGQYLGGTEAKRTLLALEGGLP